MHEELAMTDIPEPSFPPTHASATDTTVFSVILVISFCHLLNDMTQSLLPAIYPNLKADFGLTFGQIGLVTLTYQITASILQPLIGFYADRRPTPMALPGGTMFTLAGLLILSQAHSYGVILAGASMMGMGSSVFHPESSRVARMAAGPRPGLAQSLFQVGGNAGQALGPLAAAIVVIRWGQSSIAFFGLLALLSCAILWNVGLWYKHSGLARLKAGAGRKTPHADLPKVKAAQGIAILAALIFSKFVYLASITSYFTFYLIYRFKVSVQTAQLHLFVFLAAVAVGTLLGGPLGDRIGRKRVIWFSILGALPFTLLLPHVGLFWTGPLTIVIGLILSSAFPAIVVFGQELAPGNVGVISGLFFGFSFGMAVSARPCWADWPTRRGSRQSIRSAPSCRPSACWRRSCRTSRKRPDRPAFPFAFGVS
jgi:FSR family fosmidomycin resistance protein-like MFS transporter